MSEIQSSGTPRRRPDSPRLLNDDGLHLDGVRYNSEELQDLRARFGRLFTVRIKVSPDGRVVTLRDPDTLEVLAIAYAATPRFVAATQPVPSQATGAEVDAAMDALQAAMERVRRLLDGRRHDGQE
jgi:hypothetical protein